jgi:divalent metal cation (Fe/Co/Zn/Cd) transporter
MTVSKTIVCSHWFVGMFAFLFGQGSGWTYSAALKANAANFPPEHRGKAVGSMVTFFGLSSGVFTILFTSFFGHSSDELLAYLRFLATTLASVAVLGGLLTSDLSEFTQLDNSISRIWGVYINGN